MVNCDVGITMWNTCAEAIVTLKETATKHGGKAGYLFAPPAACFKDLELNPVRSSALCMYIRMAGSSENVCGVA
jgi:hypothetical protein